MVPTIDRTVLGDQNSRLFAREAAEVCPNRGIVNSRAIKNATRTLVVQENIQQRTVNLQHAVVLDKAQFPESLHEKADSRTSRVNHFG
jgi:hypothetical protein